MTETETAIASAPTGRTIRTEHEELVELFVVRDPDPESPREWDHFTKFHGFHRRYASPDKHTLSPDEGRAFCDRVVKEGGVVLPVYMLDHGGVQLSTEPFNDPWDSGQFGYILAERSDILASMSWKILTKKRRERIMELLASEVEEYDRWAQGDIWGYIVKVDGVIEDSCWGFFGREDALSDGKAYYDAVLGELKVAA